MEKEDADIRKKERWLQHPVADIIDRQIDR